MRKHQYPARFIFSYNDSRPGVSEKLFYEYRDHVYDITIPASVENWEDIRQLHQKKQDCIDRLFTTEGGPTE